MRGVAIVALLAAATPAWAGEDDEPKPTVVTASLTGTTVRLTARFAFDVVGPTAGLNWRAISTPSNALVTSGSLIVDGKRHALELMKADAAERAINALTVKPGDGGRAWAMLVDGSSSLVSIDVLAPKSASVVLELVLDAPTCFFNDRRYLDLPLSWWRVTRKRSSVRGEAEIDAACGRSDIVTDDPPASHYISFASAELKKQPIGPQRIGTIAGHLPLDTKHFARVELDVASVLSEIPKDLHTVIVVDHSRSMSGDELESQRAIVNAYVRAAPRSHVQVIGYARTAKPLLPSWTIASQAAARVEAALLELPPRNGSNLDAALREAASWLARVEGTKRILLFSDERLSEMLGSLPAQLGRGVAADTLVHVVRPTAEGLELERSESLLAPLAAATRGIEVFGAGSVDNQPDVTMLLRPISLDNVEITATGWQTAIGVVDPMDCSDSVQEGGSCMWWGEGDGAGGPITVTGLLWNTPFKRVLRPDPTQARTLARALSTMESLEEELQTQVDRVAVAVNSVWSLFGTWGRRGGYEDVGGVGTFGFGRIGGSSHDVGFGFPNNTPGMLPLDLSDQLNPAIKGCKPGTEHIAIGVETTLDEIVAVGVDIKPLNRTLRDCIVEAVWDTTLHVPGSPPHATSHVAFGNKR